VTLKSPLIRMSLHSDVTRMLIQEAHGVRQDACSRNQAEITEIST